MHTKNIFLSIILLLATLASYASESTQQEAELKKRQEIIQPAYDAIMEGIAWCKQNSPDQINLLKEKISLPNDPKDKKIHPVESLQTCMQALKSSPQSKRSQATKSLIIVTTIAVMIKTLRTFPEADAAIQAIEKEINDAQTTAPRTQPAEAFAQVEQPAQASAIAPQAQEKARAPQASKKTFEAQHREIVKESTEIAVVHGAQTTIIKGINWLRQICSRSVSESQNNN